MLINPLHKSLNSCSRSSATKSALSVVTCRNGRLISASTSIECDGWLYRLVLCVHAGHVMAAADGRRSLTAALVLPLRFFLVASLWWLVTRYTVLTMDLITCISSLWRFARSRAGTYIVWMHCGAQLLLFCCYRRRWLLLLCFSRCTVCSVFFLTGFLSSQAGAVLTVICRADVASVFEVAHHPPETFSVTPLRCLRSRGGFTLHA